MISVVIGHCNSHTAGEVVIVFTEINKELGGSFPTAAYTQGLYNFNV